jgi:eukaryotic-like serine/threonine-protein kinase
MITSQATNADAAFDALVCQISARLEAGEAIDFDRLAVEAPAHADRLRQLLPTLVAIAQISRDALDPTRSIGLIDEGETENRGTLGDFRILREVGRGGMGVVYEAEQISLARRVALKVLPFAAMLDPRQLARFRNEAQAAAQLLHQHIVPVYSVGCERGVHFYAMQFVDGQTLAQVIGELRGKTPLSSQGGTGDVSHEPAGKTPLPGKGGVGGGSRPEPPQAATPGLSGSEPARIDNPPQPPAADTARAALSTLRTTSRAAYFRTVAQLGIQAAEALEHAHENGVLHRDIKPANLMLDVRGNLWITDFGLARLETDANLTATGDVLGTLRYMSPEQAAGKPASVDQRTDIYSLGATLYEVLALRPAFDGHDRRELLNKIASEEPRPLRKLDPAIPADLETIVGKAMSKDAADRYATAALLAADLRRFLENKPIAARRPSLAERGQKWTRRHPSKVLGGMLMMLVLLVGTGVALVMVARERSKTAAALFERTEALEAVDAQRMRAEKNLAVATNAVDSLLSRIGGDMIAHNQLEHAQEILQDAVAAYETLLLDPTPDIQHGAHMAYCRLADVQVRRAAYPDALTSLNKDVALLTSLRAADPSNRQYILDLASCQQQMGVARWSARDFSGAETTWKRALALIDDLLASDQGNVEHLTNRGQLLASLAILYHYTGRVDLAEATFRQLLKAWDQLPAESRAAPAAQHERAGVQSNLATLLRDRRNQYLEARELLEDAIVREKAALAVEPENRDFLEYLVNQHFQLARTFLAEDRYDDAAKTARALASIDPRARFRCLWSAGRLLVDCAVNAERSTNATGDPVSDEPNSRPDAYRQQARELFAQAIKARDAQPEDLNRLAWSLANSVDEPSREPTLAVIVAKRIVSQRPEVARFWTTLGAAHYRAGNFAEAIEALDKSNKLDQADAVAATAFLLALAHHGSGESDDAKRWFERGVAAATDPTADQAATFDGVNLKRLQDEVERALSNTDSDKKSTEIQSS